MDARSPGSIPGAGPDLFFWCGKLAGGLFSTSKPFARCSVDWRSVNGSTQAPGSIPGAGPLSFFFGAGGLLYKPYK